LDQEEIQAYGWAVTVFDALAERRAEIAKKAAAKRWQK
jgi:hypothetical protein